MPPTLFQQWRSDNERRKFPFKDDATLTSILTNVTIPDWAFLDGKLYPIGGGAQQFCDVITKSGSEVTFHLSDDGGQDLATGEIDISEAPTEVKFYDSYDRPAGVLVSSEVGLASFGSWDDGEHTFRSSATEFAADIVVPMPQEGVRGIVVNGQLLTGDIWLYGKDGVTLTVDGSEIRIDVVGVALSKRHLCEGSLSTKRFIKTVNGELPDENGDFSIAVLDTTVSHPALRLHQKAGAIRFTIGKTTT